MSVTTTTKQGGPNEPRHAPVRHPRRRLKLLPLLLVAAGIVVLVYPVLATQYNNLKQQEFASQYNHQVQAQPPDQLLEDRSRAAR